MRTSSDLRTVQHRLVRQLDEEVEASARDAAAEMRRQAPVDTGELVGSIEQDGGRIAIAAEHWVYVNYGTSDTDAQPFLEPGIERGKQRMARIRLR